MITARPHALVSTDVTRNTFTQTVALTPSSLKVHWYLTLGNASCQHVHDCTVTSWYVLVLAISQNKQTDVAYFIFE